MLLTTSKKPTFHMRTVAHAFSCAIPNSSFEGRGKRSLESMLKKGKAAHLERLCLIHKLPGGNCSLAFLSLEEEGFSRLSPTISVKKLLVGKKAPKKCLSLKIVGSKAPILKRLLGQAISEGEPSGTISAGSRLLSISIAGKTILKAQVGYDAAKAEDGMDC